MMDSPGERPIGVVDHQLSDGDPVAGQAAPDRVVVPVQVVDADREFPAARQCLRCGGCLQVAVGEAGLDGRLLRRGSAWSSGPAARWRRRSREPVQQKFEPEKELLAVPSGHVVPVGEPAGPGAHDRGNLAGLRRWLVFSGLRLRLLGLTRPEHATGAARGHARFGENGKRSGA